jgi:hypothetical protein
MEETVYTWRGFFGQRWEVKREMKLIPMSVQECQNLVNTKRFEGIPMIVDPIVPGRFISNRTLTPEYSEAFIWCCNTHTSSKKNVRLTLGNVILTHDDFIDSNLGLLSGTRNIGHGFTKSSTIIWDKAKLNVCKHESKGIFAAKIMCRKIIIGRLKAVFVLNPDNITGPCFPDPTNTFSTHENIYVRLPPSQIVCNPHTNDYHMLKHRNITAGHDTPENIQVKKRGIRMPLFNPHLPTSYSRMTSPTHGRPEDVAQGHPPPFTRPSSRRPTNRNPQPSFANSHMITTDITMTPDSPQLSLFPLTRMDGDGSPIFNDVSPTTPSVSSTTMAQRRVRTSFSTLYPIHPSNIRFGPNGYFTKSPKILSPENQALFEDAMRFHNPKFNKHGEGTELRKKHIPTKTKRSPKPAPITKIKWPPITNLAHNRSHLPKLSWLNWFDKKFTPYKIKENEWANGSLKAAKHLNFNEHHMGIEAFTDGEYLPTSDSPALNYLAERISEQEAQSFHILFTSICDLSASQLRHKTSLLSTNPNALARELTGLPSRASYNQHVLKLRTCEPVDLVTVDWNRKNKCDRYLEAKTKNNVIMYLSPTTNEVYGRNIKLRSCNGLPEVISQDDTNYTANGIPVSVSKISASLAVDGHFLIPLVDTKLFHYEDIGDVYDILNELGNRQESIDTLRLELDSLIDHTDYASRNLSLFTKAYNGIGEFFSSILKAIAAPFKWAIFLIFLFIFLWCCISWKSYRCCPWTFKKILTCCVYLKSCRRRRRNMVVPRNPVVPSIRMSTLTNRDDQNQEDEYDSEPSATLPDASSFVIVPDNLPRAISATNIAAAARRFTNAFNPFAHSVHDVNALPVLTRQANRANKLCQWTNIPIHEHPEAENASPPKPQDFLLGPQKTRERRIPQSHSVLLH